MAPIAPIVWEEKVRVSRFSALFFPPVSPALFFPPAVSEPGAVGDETDEEKEEEEEEEEEVEEEY